MITSELGVGKEKFKKATKKQYNFLYVNKPRKKRKEILLENFKYIILKEK